MKGDPNSPVGKQIRNQIKGEVLADIFDQPERDIAAEVAALRGLSINQVLGLSTENGGEKATAPDAEEAAE